MRKPTGRDPLAVAAAAFVASILLAWLAPGTLVAGFPLWDAALAGTAVSILVSVLAFPGWWEWSGSWNAKRQDCERHQHPRRHEIELIGVRHRIREQRRGSEPRHGRAHHPARGPLAVDRRATPHQRLTATRRASHAPIMGRAQGRSRG